jgi:hypothetical protein
LLDSDVLLIDRRYRNDPRDAANRSLRKPSNWD